MSKEFWRWLLSSLISIVFTGIFWLTFTLIHKNKITVIVVVVIGTVIARKYFFAERERRIK